MEAGRKFLERVKFIRAIALSSSLAHTLSGVLLRPLRVDTAVHTGGARESERILIGFRVN